MIGILTKEIGEWWEIAQTFYISQIFVKQTITKWSQYNIQYPKIENDII